ncbi:MAG: hypothetical protein WC894_01045 [Patescibacteria group bacterium]
MLLFDPKGSIDAIWPQLLFAIQTNPNTSTLFSHNHHTIGG